MVIRSKRQAETRRRPPPQGSREGRYTETAEKYERRLRRDRILGTAGLVIFGPLLLVNLLLEWWPEGRLLPGGHSEAYFFVGILGLAYSAWVRFDRGMNRGKRR